MTTEDHSDNTMMMNPSDVSAVLNLNPNTLRKYSITLEKASHVFYKSNQGKRGYSDRDVVLLRRFIELKDSTDITLEKAAEQVVAWHKQYNRTPSVTNESEKIQRYEDVIERLEDKIDKQGELLEKLVHKLDTQQRYIDQSLEDRDKKMMNYIRENQEKTKHLLETTVHKDKDEDRKGFFQRLFGK